jgi:hypothetical protein
MPLMPERDVGGHSRHRRNWQAQIFRRPVLQEQQTNDDTQNTQRTGGPRCEKAVDRRHNISPVNALRLCILSAITVSRPSTFRAWRMGHSESTAGTTRTGSNLRSTRRGVGPACGDPPRRLAGTPGRKTSATGGRQRLQRLWSGAKLAPARLARVPDRHDLSWRSRLLRGPSSGLDPPAALCLLVGALPGSMKGPLPSPIRPTPSRLHTARISSCAEK